MKTTQWLLAGALLSFGGAAFAHNGDCKDEHKDQHASAQHVKKDAHQAANDVSSDVKEEGHEARASLDNSADKVETKVEHVKDESAQKADQAADATANKAEAAGSGISESVHEAQSAVKGEPSQLERGQLDRGDNVHNTVTISPFAMFTGSGLNFLYARPFTNKISGVAGANYSRTATTSGAATVLGLTAGADYFLIGQRNEGLRIGPRLELGFGRDSISNAGGFGQVGAAAELGYNWISAKGLTAEAGLGLHGSVGAGTVNNASSDSMAGNFGPYGKLGIGYSW